MNGKCQNFGPDIIAFTFRYFGLGLVLNKILLIQIILINVLFYFMESMLNKEKNCFFGI